MLTIDMVLYHWESFVKNTACGSSYAEVSTKTTKTMNAEKGVHQRLARVNIFYWLGIHAVIVLFEAMVRRE